MKVSRDDVLAWLRAYAAGLAESKDYLTELDSAVGDADHGINMARGFEAVAAKLPAAGGKDLGSIFKTVGMTLVSTVGGASGPLYGTLFLQVGVSAAGKTELTLEDSAAAFQSGVDGLMMRGKAAVGDKTMVDALVPAVRALKEAAEKGKSFSEALKDSAEAAERGKLSTVPLVARKGRASYLGERSAGHLDPGAASAELLVKTAAASWTGGGDRPGPKAG